jgi:hypothetical protein
MNLRNKPEPKKRGRPPIKYQITPLGYFMAKNLTGEIEGGERVFRDLEDFAKKFVKKGEIPAIIFDGAGGHFTGVKKE